MKTVDFNGRSITASCKYCGSHNVTMDRSPIWDDGDWSIPNITPYSNEYDMHYFERDVFGFCCFGGLYFV